MSFVVDVVSEDSFYVNLLLGLYKILKKHPQIENITLERRSPCDKTQVSAWEQKNGCFLTEDMKNFYLSMDGLTVTWSFKYAENQTVPVGLLEVRPLADIVSVGDTVELPQNVKPPTCTGEYSNTHPKIFQMATVQDKAQVLLLYSPNDLNPTIWFYDHRQNWHFLAPNFTMYFRMLLVHHGLPNWQFCFTPDGLESWAEEIFLLIAPHLLKTNVVKTRKVQDSWLELQQNHIDPSIFTTDTQILNKRYKTNCL